MYQVKELEVNWRAFALWILSPKEISIERSLEYFYSDTFVPLEELNASTFITDQDVVEMVNLHGELTYQEIADIYHITKWEVYYRIRKYRQALKEKGPWTVAAVKEGAK